MLWNVSFVFFCHMTIDSFYRSSLVFLRLSHWKFLESTHFPLEGASHLSVTVKLRACRAKWQLYKNIASFPNTQSFSVRMTHTGCVCKSIWSSSFVLWLLFINVYKCIFFFCEWEMLLMYFKALFLLSICYYCVSFCNLSSSIWIVSLCVVNICIKNASQGS